MEDASHVPERGEKNRAGSVTVTWAASALVLTAILAIVAKTLGVLIAPGLHGVLSQNTVEVFDTLSATFAYTVAALLVALVCGASFELARSKRILGFARGGVVAATGLVIALASPAVVQRLNSVAAFGLAIVTSLIAIIAGFIAARSPLTRATGVILAVLAVCGLLRVTSWGLAAISADRGSAMLHEIGKGLATTALILHAIATLLAAAWLGTRGRWAGRILANGAIVIAFVITYFAARSTDSSSIVEAVLKNSLAEAAGTLIPMSVRSIAAFLVPVSILLAAASLLQRAQPRAVVASLALALLSHGAFDVPLQALLIIAAAQWAMLAATDSRPVWSARRSS